MKLTVMHITVHSIIQKLKNKHTSLKKYTNWESWGISHFDITRGEKKQIFPTFIHASSCFKVSSVCFAWETSFHLGLTLALGSKILTDLMYRCFLVAVNNNLLPSVTNFLIPVIRVSTESPGMSGWIDMRTSSYPLLSERHTRLKWEEIFFISCFTGSPNANCFETAKIGRNIQTKICLKVNLKSWDVEIYENVRKTFLTHSNSFGDMIFSLQCIYMHPYMGIFYSIIAK